MAKIIDKIAVAGMWCIVICNTLWASLWIEMALTDHTISWAPMWAYTMLSVGSFVPAPFILVYCICIATQRSS